jgi:hypothetical protein
MLFDFSGGVLFIGYVLVGADLFLRHGVTPQGADGSPQLHPRYDINSERGLTRKVTLKLW